jgi:aminoglycoside 3-N-acetyltransferase
MSTEALRTESIVRDLKRLGVQPGDSILVHTSLKRVGYLEDGPTAFIHALAEAVGPTGTVLFPCLTGRREDSAENPPAFSARSTPTTLVGIVPETAWRIPNAIRSSHPTHSVAAIGSRAEWFCADHEKCASPCGMGSPYHKLATSAGKILLVGCSPSSNTSLHMIEEIAGVPYHLLPGRARYFITDWHGDQVEVDTSFHSWSFKRNFEIVSFFAYGRGFQVEGFVGTAKSILVSAQSLMVLILAELAKNPTFLLAK